MASESTPAPRFFVLKVPARGDYDTDFYGVDDNVGKGPRCPQCDSSLGSLVWLPPYRGELDLVGKGFGDLVRTGGDDLLMTERMTEAFQQAGLKGLSGFEPVEIVRVLKRGRRKPLVPPKYFRVSPAFLSAAVDEARSRIQRQRPIECAYCRERAGLRSVYSLALEEGSWNGDDIFRPRGLTGTILVSERFERFVTQHGFTNMELTPTEKYVLDFYPRPSPSTPKASA
jgi:hypothetical protein